MVIGSDASGCFKDTGYATIKIYAIPTVSAGPDVTIHNGQSTVLNPVMSSDVTSVYWIPNSTIISRLYPSVTVMPKETTEYTIEVKNPGGCKAVDKVTVFVLCDGTNMFIPNTFSPNGDGSNDVFYPRGTGLFSIKTFRIFDRWGEVVFERSNFMPNDASMGWDGTFKGKKLTSDVYIYTAEIVCENSTVLTHKGNVALLQ
jgi:gliding motility-associated-like protein